MILDERLEFCDAVDVSSTVGTSLEGDVIDLGATPQDYGSPYRPMYLVIQVTTAFATATTATAQFTLATDAAAAIATNGTATEHIITDAFDTGVLVQGYTLQIPLPQGVGLEYERYMGILVTTAGATTTAGSINAFLTSSVSNQRLLPDAQN